MKTKTHFAFRVDIWDDAGDSIVEHVAGADDFQVAEAIYCAAIARWPTAGGWGLLRFYFFTWFCRLGPALERERRCRSPNDYSRYLFAYRL